MSKVYEEKAKIYWFVLGLVPIANLLVWLMVKNEKNDALNKLVKGMITLAIVLVFVGVLVGMYYLMVDPHFIGLTALLI